MVFFFDLIRKPLIIAVPGVLEQFGDGTKYFIDALQVMRKLVRKQTEWCISQEHGECLFHVPPHRERIPIVPYDTERFHVTRYIEAHDDEITEHVRECEIIAELSWRLVEENVRQGMDKDEFIRKYGPT